MKKNWKWILAIVVVFLVVFRIGLAIFMRVGHASFGMMRGYVVERRFGMMRSPWMMQGRGMMGFGGRGFGMLVIPLVLLLVALGVFILLRRHTVKPVVNVAANPSTPTPTATVAQNPVEAVIASPTAACPNCGKPVQGYWVACPNCGEKLPPNGGVEPS